MKTLSKYFDTCSLWIVFVLSFVFFVSFCYLLFYYVIPNDDIRIHNVMLKFSVGLSFMFSILITFSFNISRKSDVFFDYRDKVESLINDTDTVKELKDLFDVEIKKMWTMSQGGIHSQEINRLVSLINIKIETIGKLKP